MILSTESNFGTLKSSTTQAGLSKSFAGLSSDTLYYYAVKNAAEGDAAFADLANNGWQRTLPTPLRPALTAATMTSLTASWAAVSAGSSYVAVLSSAADYTGIVSSATVAANTAAFAGLQPYTTYFFEVKLSTESDTAYSGNQAEWRTAPGGTLLAPALAAVAQKTLSAGWNIAAGASYNVVLAADANYTVVLSSTVETSSPTVYTGLVPDTSYYLMVKLAGQPDYEYIINRVPGRTLPTRIVPALVPATPGRLNAYWTSLPGAYYSVALALDQGFTNIVSSMTTETVIKTYTGLIGAMPYYLGVKLVSETEAAYTVNWSSAVAPAGALRLFALAPNKVLRGEGVMPVVITGEGITPDSTIRLIRTGYSDVIPSSVTWVNPGKMTCNVPRTLAIGQWTVLVTGGGVTTALPNGLVLMTAAPNSAKIFQGIFKPNLGEAAQLTTSLTSAGDVSIKIYDALGRSVRNLFEGFRSAGDYLDTWDGRNGDSSMSASGGYLIRFECPGFSVTKRVVLVK
ncbi:MAG: hypothetical protein A2107_09595 [Verrucomicrobia bacterium GWF2_62_7]|nr:MAG: hypothetical protein A2107_09595 [Verrucomicrobia bacterium GWF2_62_7]